MRDSNSIPLASPAHLLATVLCGCNLKFGIFFQWTLKVSFLIFFWRKKIGMVVTFSKTASNSDLSNLDLQDSSTFSGIISKLKCRDYHLVLEQLGGISLVFFLVSPQPLIFTKLNSEPNSVLEMLPCHFWLVPLLNCIAL